jgi:hypothetical protein
MNVLPVKDRLPYLAAATVLTLVAWLYWPVLNAGFVWIDKLDFVDSAGLRQGDAWKHLVLRDFNNWTQYFRPLVVALFAIQLRLFDALPGPMHAVSLAMHLANMLMVGLLAKRVCGASERNSPWLGLLAMVLYGLHPLLIEPVAWIGCQFELVTNLLTMVCLLASTGIQRASTRAVIVATLFFLAACAKESAVSIPLLVLLFDWLLYSDRATQPMSVALRRTAHRNLYTYFSMALAGIVYLAFRHWGLGTIKNPFAGNSQPLAAHLQEIAFLYVHYWQSLLWPTSTGPIHPLDVARFLTFSAASFATDVAAAALFVTGVWLALRRASVAGCIVLAGTACLLPVLHIATISFDSSLYHDRYAMTALATVCVLVMRIRLPRVIHIQSTPARAVFATAALLWTVLASMTVRATLPLWADNIHLWQWAITEYPKSTVAIDNLIVAYMDNNDYQAARALAEKTANQGIHCPDCLLNDASSALALHDLGGADRALQQLRDYHELTWDRELFRSYLITTGDLLSAKGQYRDAVTVLRQATEMDPLVAEPQLSLGLALAADGDADEAHRVLTSALLLLPPDQRQSRTLSIDKAIKLNTAQAVRRGTSTLLPVK